MVDWKAASSQECFNEYVNKEQRIEIDIEDDEEPESECLIWNQGKS